MADLESDIASRLTAIRVAKPADLIIRQIRKLIADGAVRAGDRLPSERELAQRFGVGRGHVREALRKLELYGVLRTYPQSGTRIASLGTAALEGVIGSLLALDRDDVRALTETRVVLELAAVRLAAERARKPALDSIRRALEAFRAEVASGRPGIEEDHLFHLAIANATGNPVIASLIGFITPDVIRVNHEARVCEGGRAEEALREHERVYAAVAARDPAAADRAMSEHMRMTRKQYERPAAARAARRSAR